MELPYTEFYANPKIFGMVGDPMAGGPIPASYNKCFEASGINRVMLPLKVEKGGLKAFVEAAKVIGIEQYCLTMPHKSDIIPFLDIVDDSSRLFNSVNIVTTTEDGQLEGHGFDGVGTVGALKNGGAKLQGAKVMMIGAGAISGIIGYEMSKSGVAQLTILNRTVANAEKVAGVLNANTPMKTSFGGLTEKEMDAAAADADVLIQVSGQGMRGMGDFAYLGFFNKLPKGSVVMESVMAPIETSFVKAARAAGFDPILGLDMTMNELGIIFDFLFKVEMTHEMKKMMVGIMCQGYGLQPPKHWQ